MDRLRRSHLPGDLTGRIFLSQDDAFATLVSSPDDEKIEQREDIWLARGLI